MARRPGLEKVTKTIPLGGGISDEIPEFLLAAPGMAYIENGSFQKIDQVEKTEPFTTSIPTGTLHSQTPFVLYEEQGNLVTIGSTIATFDGTAWTNKSLPYSPHGLSSALSTAGESGGTGYSWAPFEYEVAGNRYVTGFCIAFERRNHGSQNTSATCSAIVQRYDTRGIFLDESVLMPPGATDSFTPLVQPVMGSISGQFCAVMFCDDTGQSYRITVTDTSTIFPLTYVVIPSAATVTHTGQAPQQAGINPTGSRRISATASSKFHAALKYKQSFNGNGVIGWKESGGRLQVQVTNENGARIGVPVIVRLDVGFGEQYVLLDVDSDDTYMYVLAGKRRSANPDPTSAVEAFRINKTSGLIEVFELKAASDTVDFQGTIKVRSNGTCFFAYSTTDGNEQYNFQSTETKIVYGTIGSSWLTKTNTGNLRNHVIASNAEWGSDGYPHMVVQQWGNYSPYSTGTYLPDIEGTTQKGAHALTPASQKPVTSALVKVLGANRHTVVSIFDAGQSRDRDGSYQELDQSYGNLYYVSGV